MKRFFVVTLAALLLSLSLLSACSTAPAAPTIAPATPTVQRTAAPATAPTTAPTTAPASTTPPTPTAAPATPTRVPATATSAPPPNTPTPASSLRVTLNTNPSDPMMGEIEFVVQVHDVSGQPLNDAEVQVTATNATVNAKLGGKATAQGNGRYNFKGSLSAGGSWYVKVEVKKAGLQAVTREFELQAMDH